MAVEKSDGKVASWYLSHTERLLSAGDCAIPYTQHALGVSEVPASNLAVSVCGEVGFDADGDVIVLKQDGRRATWFARKCT